MGGVRHRVRMAGQARLLGVGQHEIQLLDQVRDDRAMDW